MSTMMESTFITVHDLTLDAPIRFCTISITDILGYAPEEVINKSCWEYFHPDEIPFAKAIHGRGIRLDKAAVLNYCRIKDKNGRWVGCECVFTVVHDVLVGCTSVYRCSANSQNRAIHAPVVRQLFSSSPRDPRYHMLTYISSKFIQSPKSSFHEPRAALILNRFSRTLPIIYATNGLAEQLGIDAGDLLGKSFFYLMRPECHQEAIGCIERAKMNESIAYLRFWYRNPRDDTNGVDNTSDTASSSSSDESEDGGGVNLQSQINNQTDTAEDPAVFHEYQPRRRRLSRDDSHQSRSYSGNSTDADSNQRDAVFERRSIASSVSSVSSERHTWNRHVRPRAPPASIAQKPIELEAVISCTTDGMVVVLRVARPLVLNSIRAPLPKPLPVNHSAGVFAAPWAVEPLLPNVAPTDMPHYDFYSPAPPAIQLEILKTSPPTSFPSAPLPKTNGHRNGYTAEQSFMDCIREVACFAWALTGINGNIEMFSRGEGKGQALPSEGLPIWNPDGRANNPPMRYFRAGSAPQEWNHDKDYRGRVATNDLCGGYRKGVTSTNR